MWATDNGKNITKCDCCRNTIPRHREYNVRISNIHLMDICSRCVDEIAKKIKAFRSPESAAWYFDTIGPDV